MKTTGLIIAGALAVAIVAVGASRGLPTRSPEQIEQERIHKVEQAEREREQAERERLRQTYISKETAFGAMIAAHTRNYREVKEKAAQNGMITTDGLREKRDAEAMAWFKATNFKFDHWEAKIVKIGGPSTDYCPKGMAPCIDLTVKMTTADGLVLRASTPQTKQFVTMLTASKPGDALVISGRFVQRYANSLVLAGEKQMDLMPKTPKDMEVSLTENGSMDDPEYRIVIDSMFAKEEGPH